MTSFITSSCQVLTWSSHRAFALKSCFLQPSSSPSSLFLLQGGVGAQRSRRDRGGTGIGELHGPAAALWGRAREQRGPSGGGKVTDRVGVPGSLRCLSH